MAASPPFIPGLVLAAALYREAVRPILDAAFPSLAHSAGLLGYGSDVLGFDDGTSRDHDWGPRGYVFLSEADHARHADAVRTALRAQLPVEFRSYPVHFSPPDPSDNSTRRMQPGQPGRVDSLVEVVTWEAFLGRSLGRRRSAEPDLIDWLTFPEQSLLELTSGAIFHDGLGTVVPARERFAYFPDDVWLHRLSAQWQRIAQEEAFVGRCAEVGDELGSQLVGARVVRDMLRLAFLMERQYAPYSKWLGSAFSRLDCAVDLAPPLERAVAAVRYDAREQALCAAGEALARMHNRLAITDEIEPTVRSYFARPYRLIGATRFDRAIRARIRDERIRDFPSQLAAVDQLVDHSGAARSPILTGRMRKIYGE